MNVQSQVWRDRVPGYMLQFSICDERIVELGGKRTEMQKK